MQMDILFYASNKNGYGWLNKRVLEGYLHNRLAVCIKLTNK